MGNIWLQQDGARCHTAEAALDVLRSVLEDRIISRRAVAVWPPRSRDLTPFDKCYVDKPEIIDTLKASIRKAIGEMQLRTIDNVLKNWTDSVGYYMASRGHGRFVLSNKNGNWKKYSIFFF